MRQIWRHTRTLLGLLLRRPLLGTTIIPVLPDGTIVLVRRRDDGLWSLPGGLVDWGEDIVTAARRELTEETGLDVRLVGRLVGVYSLPKRDPRFHSVAISVEMQVQGTFRVEDSGEVLEVRAFPAHALPLGDLSHDHDRQLQDYLAGETVLA